MHVIAPEIVRLAPGHLTQAVALSQAEDWPHQIEDWRLVLDISHGFAAVRDGTVVATALRTDFGPLVSMANMVIVHRQERGRGLGQRLLSAAFAGQENREFRLVATEQGQPLYEKLGFRAMGDIVKHSGRLAGLHPPSRPIEPVAPDNIEEVCDLDAKAFAGSRRPLLSWLSRHGALAIARTTGGSALGYAGLRRFGDGWVIGPIMADTRSCAVDLIRHLGSGIAGQTVRIDTDGCLGLGPWLEEIGLPSTGGGTLMRMNSKTEPLPAYGLFSQALG